MDEPVSERLEEIESVALRRMIEEVRGSDTIRTPDAYNRTHNRHNR